MAPAPDTANAPQSLGAAMAKYGGLLLLAALLLALLWSNPYWVNILAYTYLFAALAAAWNIIGGFGGQFSLGHGVFFAIGAYSVARLYLDLGVTPWLGIFPAAALATLVALLISWPTFRLRGPFFAIATMAINEACAALANYSDKLTGGPRGILIPFRASLSNMIFIERWKYALLMFSFMVIVVLITVWLRRARLGHYLMAIRADEDAAGAAGINVLKVKLQGMALSAFLTGIGGGLFAMYVRVLDPPSLFTLPDIGVKFALIALIGGIGTIIGPVIGAILIVPLENFLRGWLGGDIPGGHLIVLGAVLVIASLFLKRGVVGALVTVNRRFPGAAMTTFLAVEQATRRFAGLVAVDSVSFAMQRGEILSLIGPNGAGKTTLFNLISGQLKPSDGAIVFRDERLNDLPPSARAQRGMGRTFQIAKPLIGLTARENVMVGAFLRHARHDDAYEAATKVLTEVGLEALAEVPAGELTLSERRRLEVARALALEPELILLDEVMAGLNATEITQVIELIHRLNARGMTFLVIEHNLKVVRAFSQRVIVLDHGAKIAEGTAADVLRDPEVVRAYLGKKHGSAA